MEGATLEVEACSEALVAGTRYVRNAAGIGRASRILVPFAA